MVQFLLHNQLVNLDDIAPSVSVLEYLRTTLALVGTKEGCAAGDCGACTVVLGELVDEQNIQYKTINACITPVGSLHGKQLLTVEHLQQANELHPVQQAMVECHGSQCGFCTPGIVMSLFAWWKNQQQSPALVNRHAVETALSGNLCRCTGYQPIFRAAEQTLAAAQEDSFSADLDQTIKQLQKIQQGPAGSLNFANHQFFAPSTVADLIELKLQNPSAALVAGATDLGLEFTQQLKPCKSLIYTGNVKECRKLTETDTTIEIGSALTYSELQPTLANHFPAFAQLLDRLGSLQIRNQGTLGGNVANASPIGDTPPVLLALDAEVKLAGKNGARHVPIREFFTGYRTTQMSNDEFITGFSLPKLCADETLKVYKISKRFDDDISAVCLALWLKFDGKHIVNARIGCGGMAATPLRALNAEKALLGQPFNEASVQQAGTAFAQDFSPLDDVRASKQYRLAVAANLLVRAWHEHEGNVPVHLFSDYHAGSIAGGFYHA